jgi:hypothetical protein
MSTSGKLNGHGKLAIASELEDYCVTHPDSPTAIRQPRIVIDQGRYVVALGKSTRDGVFGFGTSVESALRCFDELYLRQGLTH